MASGKLGDWLRTPVRPSMPSTQRAMAARLRGWSCCLLTRVEAAVLDSLKQGESAAFLLRHAPGFRLLCLRGGIALARLAQGMVVGGGEGGE